MYHLSVLALTAPSVLLATSVLAAEKLISYLPTQRDAAVAAKVGPQLAKFNYAPYLEPKFEHQEISAATAINQWVGESLPIFSCSGRISYCAVN